MNDPNSIDHDQVDLGQTDPDETVVCIEADGLALEIAMAGPAAALDAGLDRGLATVIASAIAAANRAVGPVEGAVAILVDDDRRIRALNREWRGLDKPTNVLSFPSPDAQPGPTRTIGDIAISYETTAREAAAEGKPLGDHVAHLAVHGFLHLLGYDHESDKEAEEMEGIERSILARIGIADPYAACGAEG